MKTTIITHIQRRYRQLTGSLKLRLVLVFLLLALAMMLVLVLGIRSSISIGWREAARPILTDYVNRLFTEVTTPEGSPSIERAQRLTEELPISVEIRGPQINWSSHPQHRPQKHPRYRSDVEYRQYRNPAHGPRFLHRTTSDGHTLTFGVDDDLLEQHPYLLGYLLTGMLLLTLLAWLYIRHLLKPLDAIGKGVTRFGSGQFTQPITTKESGTTHELTRLATTINRMGQDIHQMLEAKRALLLAISHELRSPLTRARLNTELLPETELVQPQREALLQDLQEMAQLISNLLESERLNVQHARLHRETVDLGLLIEETRQSLASHHPEAVQIQLVIAEHLPQLQLDPERIRLLLRNLLNNALQHGRNEQQPPEIHLSQQAQDILLTIRDYGPGIDEQHLNRLAQAFYRPDSARTRSKGGVGLGLYLCRLIVEAHGGSLQISNRHPGLQISIQLPLRQP